MRIRTIVFRAERDKHAPAITIPGHGTIPPSKTPEHLRDGFWFRSNGNLYRTDELNAVGNVTDSNSFNGRIYQYFHEDLSAYRESDKLLGTAPPTPFPDPISWAYHWVFGPHTKHSWVALHSDEEWELAAKAAHLVREERSPEGTVATIELVNDSDPATGPNCMLNLDGAHGYVPISWSLYPARDRNKVFSSYRATRWLDVDAGDAGRLRIPIEAAVEEGDVKGVCWIVPGSLRVNQAIDDDIFTLQRSRAKNIWSEPHSRQAQSSEADVALQVGVILFTALFATIAIVWAWRRRNRGRDGIRNVPRRS
jgi:hypothetical protein